MFTIVAMSKFNFGMFTILNRLFLFMLFNMVIVGHSFVSCSIHGVCQQRKAKLEGSVSYFQFLQDSSEGESWLLEKIHVAKSPDIGKDLISCLALLKRHEVWSDSNINCVVCSNRLFVQ